MANQQTKFPKKWTRDEAYAQYNGFLCDALGQCDDKYSGMAGELESWTADFGRQVAMLVAQEEA